MSNSHLNYFIVGLAGFILTYMLVFAAFEDPADRARSAEQQQFKYSENMRSIRAFWARSKYEADVREAAEKVQACVDGGVPLGFCR